MGELFLLDELKLLNRTLSFSFPKFFFFFFFPGWWNG
jgi:hypothetical protein